MKLKLTDILKSNHIISEGKTYKYGLKSMGGGYSDGVDISPGKNQSAGKILLSATLYGGGEKKWYEYPVPDEIREYMEAKAEAERTGDPISADIDANLEAYYELVKKEIGRNIIAALQEFDQKAMSIIKSSVNNVNRKYQSDRDTLPQDLDNLQNKKEVNQ